MEIDNGPENLDRANRGDEIPAIIDKTVGDVRIGYLDMSLGELLSLKSTNDLIITPDYQRLFRWSRDQQSRLIESILLGLPIPQLFVVENSDNTLELIDGLQRVSSVIHFLQPEPGVVGEVIDEPDLDERGNPLGLKLQGCDIVKELNGFRSDDLPLSIRLQLKRSPVRVTIIKKQSKHTLRYEMFKRLNTGGDALSEQEIRNCTARLIGDRGIQFYSFLMELCRNPDFLATITSLSQSDRDKKGDEELVLRFFALKNSQATFRGSVSDWLTRYMEHVTLGDAQFDYDANRTAFERVFRALNAAQGADTFVRFKDDRPIGALAPAFFEGVTMAAWRNIDETENLSADELNARLARAKQDEGFLQNVGPGANSKQKLQGRIDAISACLNH